MLQEQRNYTSRSKLRTRRYQDDALTLTLHLGEDQKIKQFELLSKEVPRDRKIQWHHQTGVNDSESRNFVTRLIFPPQSIEPLLQKFRSRSAALDKGTRDTILDQLSSLKRTTSVFTWGGSAKDGELSITRRDQDQKGRLSDEAMAKVKRIELATRKRVDDLMSGSFKSHFKGHGVQFSEHRVYMPGDDVRHIDWKVSARTRDPLIKKFEEERELTVLLVVDVSGSKNFGSHSKLKSEMVAEIGGMLAYAASHTGDKVGVLLFAGEVEKIIPPKKGKQHIQRVIRDLLVHEPQTPGTDMSTALRAAHRIMKHAGVVFLISDFLADDYHLALKQLARKNDVVALWTRDPREDQIPKMETLRLKDPESGREFFVNPGSYRFKTWHAQFLEQRAERTLNELKSCGVEVTQMSTHEDYLDSVARFFRKRNGRG